ncbi:hypothetical protein DID88_006946 [Monilinia fructigena]|uniref:RING-type domain-containing protein n=1 Tax=Monilinia fructigena TaxID=38457 RepID=A0A395IGD8_9HELO|nr:hypothetical protein DID88_006946 [Monilinia fructigena]
MSSDYPHSHSHSYLPPHNNRNSNTASTVNNNIRSPWNNASFSGRGRGENEFLTLPPISQATNSRNTLELPGLSSSPLFIPETHTRQIQPELSSYGSPSTAISISTSTSTSTSNTNTNLNSASTNTTTNTTTSTFTPNSNPQSNHIKRPQGASPRDLLSFDPYDQSSHYRSPPPLQPPPLQPPPLQPPPNQSAQQISQPTRGSSFYRGIADIIAEFDFDCFTQDIEPSEDSFASPPQIASRTTDNHSVVDLTDNSSAMVPPPERRRALSGTSLRPASLTRPKSPKRKRSFARSSSKSSKRRKISPPKIDPDEDVEVVDLAENSNLQEYEAAKAKEQEDLMRQQNQDEATKPVKLVEFQCIICMDNPTDLTVTHCGHLFCAECLHSALHAGNTGRKTCPVCRTAVASVPGRRFPKNGTFPISIKLMTANKMGKKPTKS